MNIMIFNVQLNKLYNNNKCFVWTEMEAVGWIWACDSSLEPSYLALLCLDRLFR